MDDGLRTENFETNGSELSEPLIIHEHPRQSQTSFQVQPNRVYQKQATNPARCVQHLNQHFHQHVGMHNVWGALRMLSEFKQCSLKGNSESGVDPPNSVASNVEGKARRNNTPDGGYERRGRKR
jgi:hypothetical protein